MTKEEKILSGTDIIIRFMNLETYNSNGRVYYNEMQPDTFEIDVMGIPTFDSNFHLSWDWIMPVYKQVTTQLREASKVVENQEHFNGDMFKFLKRIEDIDCAIRCEIWGVRIWETFLGIIEAIIFINLYKDHEQGKKIHF